MPVNILRVKYDYIYFDHTNKWRVGCTLHCYIIQNRLPEGGLSAFHVPVVSRASPLMLPLSRLIPWKIHSPEPSPVPEARSLGFFPPRTAFSGVVGVHYLARNHPGGSLQGGDRYRSCDCEVHGYKVCV